MASVRKDIVVSITTPMPHRYIYVPRGSPYKTLNCRKKAREEGYDVYVVNDAKGRQMGIRVPITIFERVQEKFEETEVSRAKAMKRRDEKMNTEFSNSVLAQFPKIPTEEVPNIVEQAMKKHSGRVGRTGTLDISEKAQLGVRAYIRHKYTDYDELLKNNVSREDARAQIYEKVDKMVLEWGGSLKEASNKTADYSTDDIGKKIARKTTLKTKFTIRSRARARTAKKRSQRSSSAPPTL
ncbi:uncharacterized protein F4807DRAFT_470298 [Annulohypoxylon truncatum]|uniref:uncharacterized protein n=1 Tax=Annulohypoxylon truncatum TaxID=327061 RepID=UPI002008D389|nr:uncharacterized protein F4807DRAFT_470298 [Annulohypoxylon truncatum]KAI1206349.1 hypothetical protein F4807DRAFT_470298 [Annulohypoxylon truncatum]